MTHKECLRWWMATKMPTREFQLPELDDPRVVYVAKIKTFWERLGNMLRMGDDYEHWKDGVLERLVIMLQKIEKTGVLYKKVSGESKHGEIEF